MQGSFDTGAVVITEGSELVDQQMQIDPGDHRFAEINSTVWVAGLGQPSKIEDHLEQLMAAFEAGKGLLQIRGKQGQQPIQVVGNPLLVDCDRRSG
jgi:hypothetical protein